MFVHCPPIELLELNTENINGRRHYVTPDGKYPSITTVLGSFPKPELNEWRKQVGESEANRISKLSADRGTKFHSILEKYLNNEEIDRKEFMPDTLASFNSVKPIRHNINNIHKLAVPLYSNRLKVAGRCDAVAEYNGILSIIDYKTSKREKEEYQIIDYFLQATFYGLCYAELTNIVTQQIVILIAVEDGPPQVFIKNIMDYVKPLVNKINEYKILYN